MKAQLQVNGGDGDLPSIPGISAPRKPDGYETQGSGWMSSVSAIVALIGLALAYKMFRPA